MFPELNAKMYETNTRNGVTRNAIYSKSKEIFSIKLDSEILEPIKTICQNFNVVAVELTEQTTRQ